MVQRNRRQTALVAIGHLLNDFYNDLLPPILPLLVREMHLSLTMAGAVVSTLSVTTSLLQPLFGWLVDKKPHLGLLGLCLAWIAVLMTMTGWAPNYAVFLAMAGLAGLGSAMYHPLGSVMMTQAVNGQKGLAMSIYSSIGNFGEALVPLVVTPVAMALGLRGLVVLAVPGLILAWLLFREHQWQEKEGQKEQNFLSSTLRGSSDPRIPGKTGEVSFPPESRRSWRWIMILDVVLILRSFVHVSLIGFLPLYLVQQGYSPIAAGQVLFIFMVSGALGIPFAGLLADKYGRKPVMLISLGGTFVFLLLFLMFNGPVGVILLALAGTLILASLPLAIVAAQELIPARAGMASGLMMGFAWGLGGLGATATGALADAFGVGMALYLIIWLLIPAAVLVAFLPAHVSRPACREVPAGQGVAAPVPGAGGDGGQ